MRKLPADLSATLASGYAWWTGELASLLPGALISGGRRKVPDLAVAARGGALVGVVPPLDPPPEDEAAILREINRRAARRPVRVTLLLPQAECLVRQISVPKVAAKDINRIAMLDLERATPFRETDVLAAVMVSPAVRGRTTISAEQIVVKRSRVAALRERLEAAGAELAAVDIYQDDPVGSFGINLIAERTQDMPQSRGFLPSGPVLAGACCVLGFAALALAGYRHEHALERLREQTAAVRTRLVQARAATEGGPAAGVEALVKLKSQYPPVVVLLDDLTRRLPDSSYVTELRVADGTVELTGFGRPVRGLAPELEQSPLIASASITAPITTDEERQKERFNLTLQLDKDWLQGEDGRP